MAEPRWQKCSRCGAKRIARRPCEFCGPLGRYGRSARENEESRMVLNGSAQFAAEYVADEDEL